MSIIISKVLYHTLLVEVADPSANKLCLHTLYIVVFIFALSRKVLYESKMI